MEKASNSNLEDFTANAGSGNYTKYGAWYGINPGDWCAMFVSWCADQAGYNNLEIFPEVAFKKYADCDTGMNYFKNNGRFYPSMAYDGTYTPKPGDIFFSGTKDQNTEIIDAKHTGIVVSVSGETMTIIDGNTGNPICERTMSIRNSQLLGFAPSCIHSAGTTQKYNASYHWNACKMCDAVIGAKIAHTFNALGKCRFCPATQASTAALTISLLHE